MNLTNRQKSIYENIKSFDSTWTEDSFAKCWNEILKLSKLMSISNGKCTIELDDPNYANIKFTKGNSCLLEEKIYWNEFIKMNEEIASHETKQTAQTIKMLAERIITS